MERESFDTFHILERMILLAMADELPEVKTVIVRNVRWLERGVWKGEKTEVSSLQELAAHLTKLANSKEKNHEYKNIRTTSRVALFCHKILPNKIKTNHYEG